MFAAIYNQRGEKMNKYARGYMDIKRAEERSVVSQKRILGFIGGGLAFLMYAIASNMAFNDCLNWGIC